MKYKCLNCNYYGGPLSRKRKKKTDYLKKDFHIFCNEDCERNYEYGCDSDVHATVEAYKVLLAEYEKLKQTKV